MQILVSLVCGIVATSIVIGLCMALALSPHQSADDSLSALFITIPGAIVSAFLHRRRRLSLAFAGAGAYCLPIMLLSYFRVVELLRNPEYHAAADSWIVIGLVTVVASAISAFTFVQTRAND
jgi:hypothetical protein